MYKMLLVDDTPNDILLSRAIILDRLGGRLEVDTAQSGQEACDYVAKTPPALVLMDLEMPGMDGFRAATKMRSGGYEKPIIIWSCNTIVVQRASEDAALMKEVGATRVLDKGEFSGYAICGVIEGFLGEQDI